MAPDNDMRRRSIQAGLFFGGNMESVYELNEEQIHQLHRLYQTAWWAKGRSIEDTRRCVAGSQICIGLIDSQNQLTGFTRVLADYTFKALIFDVLVCDSHLGSGLGDAS